MNKKLKTTKKKLKFVKKEINYNTKDPQKSLFIGNITKVNDYHKNDYSDVDGDHKIKEDKKSKVKATCKDTDFIIIRNNNVNSENEGTEVVSSVKNMIEKVINHVRSTLYVLQSTDYGYSGINEAGFKAIIVSKLVSIMGKDDTLESEFPLKSKSSSNEEQNMENLMYSMSKISISYQKYDRFVDLVLKTPKAIIVIELKYCQMPYLIINRQQKKKLNRSDLINKKKKLSKLTHNDLLEMKVFQKFRRDSQTVTIQNIIKDTKTQIKTYVDIIKRDNQKDNREIFGYVIIGVGSRCIIEKYMC